MASGEFPTSFATAVVVLLRKAGDSADVMDYRPIAQLTSVYKVFTTVMATQLAERMSSLISTD